MKKLPVLLLSASLVPCGYHGNPGWHGGSGLGRGAGFPSLPRAVETVLIASSTYYVLNGIYYQRQNEWWSSRLPRRQTYVVAGNNSNMVGMDMNGERFYVNQGHYYWRIINDDYLEVPRPFAKACRGRPFLPVLWRLKHFVTRLSPL